MDKKYKPGEGVDSSSGEFGVTWILDEEMKYREEVKGNLALSMCPGKVLVKGRDGKWYEWNIAKDVRTLQTKFGVQTIVCLINKYELRTIGVD